MFAVWYHGDYTDPPGWCCWRTGNPAFPDVFDTIEDAQDFVDSLPIAPSSHRANFEVRPVPPADE